ncbi:ATP-binding protein [Clostridium magnum]|uniref:histidine kinase n=1 Tax=Clostridium magnum DSM 2767 TaxID=1121326 RepID=A0A162TIM1_9CLOT|nr:ATP-binding protein [Clostridium magnum]KZL92693.1 sensor histidine kinase YycG [Clostridium magnum DSM 2767]SHI24544.1 two-component system, OmpR family, sensor histidine kinase ResE [Clostridium magnum DSM 2767]
MFKKSITLKLTFGFLTIVVISTLLIGIIALSIFKNNIYEVKRNNMKKHAHEISEIVSPLLQKNVASDDTKNIANIVGSFPNTKTWIVNTEKNFLVISKNENNIFTSIDTSAVKAAYNSLIISGLKGIESSDELLNPYYQEEMMTISVPIKDSTGNVIGVVLLHSSIADLSSSMDSFFLYLILALIGEVFIAGFMGYYFSKSISKPIKKINSTALEMARGNYGIKTEVYSDDEVGELASTFDLMSLKLKHTISKVTEEKTKLSNIITSMSDGIIALDTNLEVININASAARLLYCNVSKLDIDIKTALRDLDLESFIEDSMTNNRKEAISRKFLNKTLNFSLSPISLDSDKAIGMVILIQDISEKEALEQMRKDFVSNVSHEFRTPLTIMKGNLESIVDGMISPSDVPESCSTLLKETNRLERMVRDLLELSKLESGKVQANFDKVDINSFIKDMSRTVKPLIMNKNIELILDLGSNLPPLLSDYDKLKQLFLIFLDNAIKFSAFNSEIKIKSTLDNDSILLLISDKGVGIDSCNIEHLGERFYKADSSRSSANNGTGLGISIAKKLIELLQGDFSIDSELSKGTTIKIHLPIMEN